MRRAGCAPMGRSVWARLSVPNTSTSSETARSVCSFASPPDLYFDQRITVPLDLVYRSKGVAPRDRKKSLIGVTLNGKFIGSKPINVREVSSMALTGKPFICR